MRAANIAASFALALAFSLTAALGIAAAVNTNSSPSLMSRADYLSQLRGVADRGRLAMAACRELSDDRRAVCRARARADERVAAAALEARYRGTVSAQQSLRLAQARAAHSISEARRLAPI